MKINFYNNFHCGDIHNSRGLITHIMKSLGNDNVYTYRHINGQKLLLDVNVEYINEQVNTNELVFYYQEELYINTWVGCKDEQGSQFCGFGCNALGNMHLLNCIYRLLKKDIIITDEWELVSDIDYTKYINDNIQNFIKPNTKNILICNGPVLSWQSSNFLFTSIINQLADKYPNYRFILTQKDSQIDKNNVYYTTDIIGNVGFPDLNEISIISTKCNVIVGRASGPFMFAQTRSTLTDETKTFISINNTIKDSFFSLDGNSKKIHSSNYEESSILNIILKEIESIV